MRDVIEMETGYSGNMKYTIHKRNRLWHGLMKRWNKDGSIWYYKVYNNDHVHGLIVEFEYEIYGISML